MADTRGAVAMALEAVLGDKRPSIRAAGNRPNTNVEQNDLAASCHLGQRLASEYVSLVLEVRDPAQIAGLPQPLPAVLQESLYRLVHSEDFRENLPRSHPRMRLRQVGRGSAHLGDGVVAGVRPVYPVHHAPGLICGVQVAGVAVRFVSCGSRRRNRAA